MGGGSMGQDSTTNPNNSGGETFSSGGGETSSQASSSAFQDPQTVWGPQSQYLQNLYHGGQQQLNNSAQGQQLGQGIYDQAAGAYNRLLNPGVNPQLEAYSGQVQQNLERNLLPTIQGNAGGFGQMGGARQGVAEGLAIGDANQQITDMSANLYNQDMDRMGQAMSMAPSLANFGMGIPWYAMNQQAGLLGDPAVLGGASGSQSSSSSQGSNFSEGYGYNYDTGGGTDEQGWNLAGHYGAG